MTNIYVLLAFLLVNQAMSTPFSENSIVVLSFYTTPVAQTTAIYLLEYTLDGNLAQTIYLYGANDRYAASDAKYHMMSRDQNGMTLAIPVLDGSYGEPTAGKSRVVLAMNSESDITDQVVLSGDSSYDPILWGAMVDGQDVWISLADTLAYTTRNATLAIVDNVLNNAVTVRYHGQIVGSTMYFLGETSSPQLYSISLPKTSASTATAIPRQDGVSFGIGISMFVYDASTFYFTTPTPAAVSKFVLVEGQLVLQYSLDLDSGPKDILAKNVGGTVYVFILTTSDKIIRLTDDGTAFTNSTDLATDLPAGLAMNMAFSPQPTCIDSIKNQGETDIDCGGPKCSKCEDNKSCLAHSDCLGGYCNPNYFCSQPNCTDRWWNQDETDIDCGASCSPCVTGAYCKKNSDCILGFCNPNLVCCKYSKSTHRSTDLCQAVPLCNDGWLNRNESDIDCGGDCPAKCSLGKNCNFDADCQSGYCSIVCVSTPPVAPVAPLSPLPSPSPTPVNQPQSSAPKGKAISSAFKLNAWHVLCVWFSFVLIAA